MIDIICYEQNYYKPRMYRKKARKDYLNLAKCKKRTAKKIRKAIKAQLQYIRRNLRYIDAFLEEIDLCDDLSKQFATIRTLVEQQQYMYENKVHSVPDRIVSISQPYIRPIVRGKAKASVEFGAKLDLSIDENGIAKRLSFDAYNESDVLITAVENYKSRTGHFYLGYLPGSLENMDKTTVIECISKCFEEVRPTWVIYQIQKMLIQTIGLCMKRVCHVRRYLGYPYIKNSDYRDRFRNGV